MKPAPGLILGSIDDKPDAATEVRDPVEDRYVVALGDDGSARSFFVIDRQLRRFPVTIPTARLH
jgi:hypothetical protein